MSGKGDTPRPYSVDQDTFASNWEATFGAKAKTATEAVNCAPIQEEHTNEPA